MTTLFTCEAGYIAASYAACQVIWLSSLHKEMKGEEFKPLLPNVDNRSAINLAKNPISHGEASI